MRIAVAAVVLAGLCLAALPAWAGEAEQPGEAVAPENRVGVVGEVKWRPELENVAGAKGWVINGQELSIEVLKDRAVLFYGPSVLQDMVAELLLQDDAKRRNITLTDQEVETKVRDLREELGLRSEAAFDSFLRMQRATRAWFTSKARSYALLEKVLADQVYVSDREVEADYKRNQAMYRSAERVAFKVMRFADKQSAEAALEAVRKGKGFEEVAKETALTPAERAGAGDMQYYERGQQSIPPEFEAALFAAPLNQVTGPVNVVGSYYLIRVEQKTDPHQFTLDEFREVIRKKLHKQKLELVVWPTWIGDQLRNAKIEVLGAK